MFSSTARSAAMFWAICSCLAASCSTLRRTTSRLDAKGSSCCTGSGAVAATTGVFVAETDNNQASVGTRATTISLAASPWDCQASVAPTPKRTAIKNRVRVRNIRLPIVGCQPLLLHKCWALRVNHWYLHRLFFLIIDGRGYRGLTEARQEGSSPRAIVRSSHDKRRQVLTPFDHE